MYPVRVDLDFYKCTTHADFFITYPCLSIDSKENIIILCTSITRVVFIYLLYSKDRFQGSKCELLKTSLISFKQYL